MHNSQKPKLNVCFENWITKTRSSFYFLPINAQTNISFNLFFWEWTFLIHQSPFDRTFEAWKPIKIQNYNQKEFLKTLITITYSLQAGQLELEGQGAMAAKTFCQITYLIIITNVVMGQIMPIRWLPTLPSPGFSDLPTALQGHIAQWVACASYCMYIASNTIWHTTHFYIYPKQGSKQAKKTLPPQYVPLTYMDILLLRL